MWPVARSVLMRHGALTAAAQREAGVDGEAGEAAVGVVHAHDQRVERAAAERGAQRGAVGGLAVDERQQVADRLDLRAGRGTVDDRARVRDAPAVPVAPRHHAGGRARGAREPLAVAAAWRRSARRTPRPYCSRPMASMTSAALSAPAVGAGIGQRAAASARPPPGPGAR